MELKNILNNTEKIKDQEIKTSATSIVRSESGTSFDMADSARKSLDSLIGEKECKKVLILKETIDKVFSSTNDSTSGNAAKKKFELLHDSIIHNDKISENALWDILRRESSQTLIQEGLRNIKDLCKASSDHIISSEKHLHALVDAIITSKKPDGKKFSSDEFLQSINVATSDQKRSQIVIQDHDHDIWKKYLDNVKNIDSDVRIKTYSALISFEKKQVEARR